MATASAEWVGVIKVGPFELDCRLFSAFGKARPLPVKFVHTKCHTVLGEVVEKEKKEVEEEEKEKIAVEKLPVAKAQEQLFCSKCKKALKSDEVGLGIETEAGIIEVSEEEIATLKFESLKRVTAELIFADDPAIEAIGFGRRLYVLPKPAAGNNYANIYYMLRESKRIGLISPLTIKDKPNVAVIRPLTIPSVISGQERKVLVVDMLNDTDRLKDPAELPGFLDLLPAPDFAVLAQPIAEAQRVEKLLDPEHCVNPKRLKLKEIIKRAVARSLTR